VGLEKLEKLGKGSFVEIELEKAGKGV